MKRSMKKQGAALGALSLALGLAVYLNWSYAKGLPQTVSAAEEDFLLETMSSAQEEETAEVYDPLSDVPADADMMAESETGKNYGEAQLVSVNKGSGRDFFETARLNRTKARDEALDNLKKTMKNTSLSEEEKAKLSQGLNNEITNITTESDLETHIKAKGFADCLVMIDGEKINVTVMTENDALTADEVTRIRDIILSKCPNAAAQNITVVEVK